MPELIPAIFTHASNCYSLMQSQAHLEVRDEVSFRLFEGSGMQIVKRLGLSDAYYSKIFDVLKEMGCVEQLKRGGGSSQSIW